MGKNKGAKSKASASASPKASPKAAPKVEQSACPAAVEDDEAGGFLQTLTEAERLAEEKKMKVREEKAKESQRKQLAANARKEWWEKEKKKEDHQWKRELGKVKNAARSDGILEAVPGEDDNWWVELPDGEWKAVQGEYYCPHCQKHLNSLTLQAHIDSKEHEKKMWWVKNASGQTPSAPKAAAAAPGPPVYCPEVPSAAPQALESWQELDQWGWTRCLACNKVIDENHLQTDSHIRRVAEWMGRPPPGSAMEYEDPPEEFKAWVPSDENNPNSEKWLKCLLCNKYVNDEYSHGSSSGSKDHEKNLRNHYGPPRSHWYVQTVLPQKERWSKNFRGSAPSVRVNGAAASSAAPAAQGGYAKAAASAVPTPAARAQAPNSAASQWKEEWDPQQKANYYWNTETREVTWTCPYPRDEVGPPLPPTPPAQAAKASGPAKPAVSRGGFGALAEDDDDSDIEEC